MSRTYRRFTLAAAFAATLAIPAPAAADWNLFDTFSPFGWIRALWAETGSAMDPLGAPDAEIGSTITPWGAPRQIWGEEGSAIDPWGRPASVQRDEGRGIEPLGRP